MHPAHFSKRLKDARLKMFFFSPLLHHAHFSAIKLMRINWLKCERANILISLESKRTEAFALQCEEQKTLEPSRRWCDYSSSYEYFGLQPKPLLFAHKVFHCRFVIWQTYYRRFSRDYRALSPRQCELTVALFPQIDEILLFKKKKNNQNCIWLQILSWSCILCTTLKWKDKISISHFGIQWYFAKRCDL